MDRSIRTIGAYFYKLRNDGVSKVISLLSRVWLSAGYNVVVLTEEQPTEQDFSLPQGVERVVLSSSGDHKSEQIRQARYNELKNTVAEHGIDLFIDNKFYSPMLSVHCDAVKDAGAYFAVYMHSSVLRLFEDNGLHEYDAVIMSANAPDISGSVSSTVERYANADLVIVLSETDRRFFEHFGIPAVYMPNPCELPLQEPPRLNGHKLLWVGRPSPEKKPLKAIEAFEKVKKAIPDADLYIVGSGFGDEPVRKKAEATDGVEFCGFRKDVETFYKSSDVYLLTSEYEGWPLTLNEARAYGLPVAAFDIPYLEILKDGRGCFTVPQDDVNELAEAVIEIFMNEGLRRELSNAGRAAYKEYSEFDWAAAWDALFARIGSGKTPNSAPMSDKEAAVNDAIIIKTMLRYHDCGMRMAYNDINMLRPLAVRGASKTYRAGETLMWLPRKLFSAIKHKKQ